MAHPIRRVTSVRVIGRSILNLQTAGSWRVRKLRLRPAAGILSAMAMAWPLLAQGPPARQHTATRSAGIQQLVPATASPPLANRVSIQIEGPFRVIRANGVPNHRTGAFPNRGNPHRIAGQNYTYRVPAKPQQASSPTPLNMRTNFGVAVNGVPFDPGAAEWYLGQRHGPWQYEALSGAVPLGIDSSHAHVQPTGAYHYHGLPGQLLDALGFSAEKHSPLVGWAADGFPIYAIYGYATGTDPASKIQAMKPSYRLKRGERPRGPGDPGGQYDGTFLADYEYVKGLGDLDECNGRFGVTPEFPEGTYAYFLTSEWPVIPRCHRGVPSSDFQRRPPGRHRPPRRR